ncbi:MAG: hypothetical protein SGJ27_22090 [Candidatus Melainabacteria bacterium]|nr:hypothetical protein [Candidatus Melainabacteria bacterium]
MPKKTPDQETDDDPADTSPGLTFDRTMENALGQTTSPLKQIVLSNHTVSR